MSEFEEETTTYRGGTLEEVLPQIREQLGPGAVIVRQREGVIGGFGGFFGKKCVEIEARPASAMAPSAPQQVRQTAPSRAVIDAYEPDEPREEELSALLQTLIEQTSPFASELSNALADEPKSSAPVETPVKWFDESLEAALEPRVNGHSVAAPAEPATNGHVDPPVAAAPVAAAPAEAPAPVEAPVVTKPPAIVPPEIPILNHVAPQASTWRPSQEAPRADDPASVRAALVRSGFSAAVADDIVSDAVRTLRPFAPGVPFGILAQHALARQVKVSVGWETKRRTIALIGTAESGRTLTAAKLCNAYAGAGRRVTALSLEPAREAFQLGLLTDLGGVGLEIADAPDLLKRARTQLRDSEIVIVDTPPLDPANLRSFTPTTRLLDTLRANETHLLLRTDVELETGRMLLETLSGSLKPTRILVTGADRGVETCVPVALSLAFGIPISFVADSPLSAAGLHPAEPAELARLTIQ